MPKHSCLYLYWDEIGRFVNAKSKTEKRYRLLHSSKSTCLNYSNQAVSWGRGSNFFFYKNLQYTARVLTAKLGFFYFLSPFRPCERIWYNRWVVYKGVILEWRKEGSRQIWGTGHIEMSAFWGLFVANQKRILDFTTMPVQRATDADDIMQEYFVNIGF